jgi:hypothetical protein
MAWAATVALRPSWRYCEASASGVVAVLCAANDSSPKANAPTANTSPQAVKRCSKSWRSIIAVPILTIQAGPYWAFKIYKRLIRDFGVPPR